VAVQKLGCLTTFWHRNQQDSVFASLRRLPGSQPTWCQSNQKTCRRQSSGQWTSQCEQVCGKNISSNNRRRRSLVRHWICQDVMNRRKANCRKGWPRWLCRMVNTLNYVNYVHIPLWLRIYSELYTKIGSHCLNSLFCVIDYSFSECVQTILNLMWWYATYQMYLSVEFSAFSDRSRPPVMPIIHHKLHLSSQ